MKPLCVFLLSCLSLITSQAESTGRLFWSNGDSLPLELLGVEGEDLLCRLPWSDTVLRSPMAQLDGWYTLLHPAKEPEADRGVQFWMFNGDHLPMRSLEVTEEGVAGKSPWGQRLELKQEFLKELKLPGTEQNPSDWEVAAIRNQGETHALTRMATELYLDGSQNQAISRMLEIPGPQSSIEITLRFPEGQPGIQFGFFGNSPRPGRGAGEISLHWSERHVRLYQRGSEFNQRIQNNLQAPGGIERRLTLRLYSDWDQGRFHLFAQGKKWHSWIMPAADGMFATVGRRLGLQVMGEKRVVVESVQVNPWSGLLPAELPPPTLQLRNGDMIPGNLVEVQGDTWMLNVGQEQLAPLPHTAVERLRLADKGHLPRRRREDIELRLRDHHAAMTLALQGMEDGHVLGSGDAWQGSARIPLAEVGLIRFRPYRRSELLDDPALQGRLQLLSGDRIQVESWRLGEDGWLDVKSPLLDAPLEIPANRVASLRNRLAHDLGKSPFADVDHIRLEWSQGDWMLARLLGWEADLIRVESPWGQELEIDTGYLRSIRWISREQQAERSNLGALEEWESIPHRANLGKERRPSVTPEGNLQMMRGVHMLRPYKKELPDRYQVRLVFTAPVQSSISFSPFGHERRKTSAPNSILLSPFNANIRLGNDNQQQAVAPWIGERPAQLEWFVDREARTLSMRLNDQWLLREVNLPSPGSPTHFYVRPQAGHVVLHDMEVSDWVGALPEQREIDLAEQQLLLRDGNELGGTLLGIREAELGLQLEDGTERWIPQREVRYLQFSSTSRMIPRLRERDVRLSLGSAGQLIAEVQRSSGDQVLAEVDWCEHGLQLPMGDVDLGWNPHRIDPRKPQDPARILSESHNPWLR